MTLGVMMTDQISKAPPVFGIQATVEALNKGRIEGLILSANLPPSRGWQCHECQGLSWVERDPTQPCQTCGSHSIDPVDLKTAMISKAYKLGCLIEVTTRDLELDQGGGVAARLK